MESTKTKMYLLSDPTPPINMTEVSLITRMWRYVQFKFERKANQRHPAEQEITESNINRKFTTP